MQNIKALAYEFLLESKIDSLPITLEKLNDALLETGTVLLPYSKVEQVIDELPEIAREDMLSAMRENDGVTVVLGRSSIILYSDELSYGERLLVAAHEIGHQKAGHKRSGVYIYKENKNDAHEKEAQAFALYVLAPPCILSEIGNLTSGKISQLTGLDQNSAIKVIENLQESSAFTAQEKELLCQFRRYIDANKAEFRWSFSFFVIFILATAIMFFVVSPTVSFERDQTSVPTASPAPTASSPGCVYVTSSGRRYHKQDCQHIVGAKITPFSVGDAIALGKTPCKTCRP